VLHLQHNITFIIKNILIRFVLHSISIFFLLSVFLSCTDKGTAYHVLSNGTSESCVACHSETNGFSPFHDPKVIGCSACHLGNIKSSDKLTAHVDMVKIPGNLSNAARTCGTSNCHDSELSRVQKSLMSTNSGIVSINRWAFGELTHTDTLLHIEDIHHSAAETHLKNLCYTCHLGYEKKHYAPTSELSRGGGCLACHLYYPHDKGVNISDNIHPSLDLNIGNDKCFGCHSRSSRISTSYEGWYETLLTKEDVKDSVGYRLLQDGRVFDFAGDDVHHKAGLLCIDCHTSQEIMGDGKEYAHQASAVKIQCTDCHTNGKHNRIELSQVDQIAAFDYGLRTYKHPSTSFIRTKKDSIALINTYFDKNNKAYLVSKITQEAHEIPNTCKADLVHDKLDCAMCHTAWVPSCIGCHTAYDEKTLLTNGKKGKWYEMMGEFSYAKPIMGVRSTNGEEVIMPAMPGMIMTLDKSHYHLDKPLTKDSIFLRLFAPVVAHTTSREVRICESCHADSEALGYGKGTLSLQTKGDSTHWKFTSLYESLPNDNLPEDAWQGFLTDKLEGRIYSSHNNFLPLSLAQQQKVLQVGVCLSCHKEATFREKMLKSDFHSILKNRRDECKLVTW